MFYMREEMPMDFDGLTQKSIFFLLKQKTPSWMKPKGKEEKRKRIKPKNIVLPFFSHGSRPWGPGHSSKIWPVQNTYEKQKSSSGESSGLRPYWFFILFGFKRRKFYRRKPTSISSSLRKKVLCGKKSVKRLIPQVLTEKAVNWHPLNHAFKRYLLNWGINKFFPRKLMPWYQNYHKIEAHFLKCLGEENDCMLSSQGNHPTLASKFQEEINFPNMNQDTSA